MLVHHLAKPHPREKESPTTEKKSVDTLLDASVCLDMFQELAVIFRVVCAKKKSMLGYGDRCERKKWC